MRDCWARAAHCSPVKITLCVFGMAVVGVVASAPRAVAQETDSADPFAGVEEMVVTGSGTAALLAETNSSSIGFNADDLDGLGVENIGDVADYVPNLEIRSQNQTNASFFVRGVGLQDFGANASSSVPIFQDGIVRNPSATQLSGLFDIGALSVMRGPQGSGNYRNASAGAISFEAAKPTSDFTGYATTTIARIVSVDARDANRYGFETAVSGPVWGDVVSIRLSTRYSHENPFHENGCANRTPIDDRLGVSLGGPISSEEAALCGEDIRPARTGPPNKSQVTPYLGRYIGEVDDFAFRGQIRIEPPDLPLDVTFRVELSNLNRDSTVGQHIGTSRRIRGSGNIFERHLGGGDRRRYIDPDIAAREDQLIDFFRNANPGLNNNGVLALAERQLNRELYKQPLDESPYRGDFDSPGRTILETNAASMGLDYELDSSVLEVNLGFVDYKKSEVQDTDMSPNILFPSRSNDQAWEVYGSLDWSGDAIADFPIEWKLGGYTLIEQVEATQRQTIAISNAATNFINDFTQEIYSFGTFAEARYEFFEGWSAEAGIRYNWERKDFDVRRFNRTVPTSPIEKSANQRTWDAITGFGLVKYEFTESIAAWMKYTRGFKAGHFNPSRPRDAKAPGRGFADPEQIDAVEWGFEFGAWADRIKGNGAIFYYNYKNYQVFRLSSTASGVFRTIENAQQARNYGAEAELVIRPLEGYAPEAIEGLNMKLNLGWLDTSFVEFTAFEERPFSAGFIGVTIDYSGNQLISAPNLQVVGVFTWPIIINRFGTITPQYDFTWTDDTPFGPNGGRGEVDNDGNDRLQPYTVGNRAYILHNVRLSYTPLEGQFEVAGFCRNLTDERYVNFGVDLSQFAELILNFVAPPRTCGMDIRFNW
ncbi:MAG: TonB-dependent receptor [bacterium]|nr:TonB-dependent receptor [bacterium]